MPVPPRLSLVVFLCIPFFRSAIASSNALRRRADIPPQGFFNPLDSNGSMVTFGFETFPLGLGEPINIILTANSDAAVLKDQEDHGGLRNYFLSLSFSSECLGQHLGSDQLANLGDGNGGKNETGVIRFNYGDPSLGSCKESVEGGNHFRYWVQDGQSANSGAIFMAVSYEQPIALEHDIIFDGYNHARDWLVGNITASAIPTEELTNTSTFSGTTQNNGYTYQTTVKYTEGLLKNTSQGINHFLTVGGGPKNITAVDGLVAALTVKITARPAGDSSAAIHSWTIPSQLHISTSTWLPLTLLFLSAVGLRLF